MRPVSLFFFFLPENACWRADVRPITRAGLHHKLCNFLQTGRGRLHPRGSFSVLDSNTAAARYCAPSPGSAATTSLSLYSATSRLLRLYQHAGYHLVLPQRGGEAPSSHLPSPVNWLDSVCYYVHVLTEGVQVCTCISAWYQSVFSSPALNSQTPGGSDGANMLNQQRVFLQTNTVPSSCQSQNEMHVHHVSLLTLVLLILFKCKYIYF